MLLNNFHFGQNYSQYWWIAKEKIFKNKVRFNFLTFGQELEYQVLTLG